MASRFFFQCCVDVDNCTAKRLLKELVCGRGKDDVRRSVPVNPTLDQCRPPRRSDRQCRIMDPPCGGDDCRRRTISDVPPVLQLRPRPWSRAPSHPGGSAESRSYIASMVPSWTHSQHYGTSPLEPLPHLRRAPYVPPSR